MTQQPSGTRSSHRQPGVVNVAIGCWAVAVAPARIQTLLGSCIGVVIHDRVARIGGLAHVVLPDSRGDREHPGKYADTAIPALLEDVRRIGGHASRGRLTVKLVGGANMFRSGDAGHIGRANQLAVERVLEGLGMPIVARDLGGEQGRRIVFDTSTGAVQIRLPGGPEYSK